MADNTTEKNERDRNIKILIRRWLLKQETAEKAKLLLSKNPRIKSANSVKSKANQ